MTRVKLVFPDKPRLWEFHGRVEIGDVNYGGHMGNEVILRKAHEARFQMLNAWGWTEEDIGGTGLILTEAWIQYKSEGFWGDDITGEIFPGEIHSRGFELLYRFRTGEDGRRELAWLRTSMLCFDYRLRKVTLMPEAMKFRLSGG